MHIIAVTCVFLLVSLSASVQNHHYHHLSPPDNDNVAFAVIDEYCRLQPERRNGILSVAYQMLVEFFGNSSTLKQCLLPVTHTNYKSMAPYTYKEREYCAREKEGEGKECGIQCLMQNALIEHLSTQPVEGIDEKVVDTLFEIVRWRTAPCVSDTESKKLAYNQTWHWVFKRHAECGNRPMLLSYIQSMYRVGVSIKA